MANIKTSEKILRFILSQNTPVSKGQIVKGVPISYKSANECLKYLEKFNQIKILTNGKTSLIQLNPSRQINE